MREQARALTGWRYTWNNKLGPVQLPLRPEASRHRHEAHLRQARPLRLARLVPPLRPPPEAPVVLRDEALGLLRPGAAERGAPGARSSTSTSTAATRSAPVVEAILRHPALYSGPRMVKSPVVYLAGLLRGARPRDRHRGLDLAARTRPASSSSTRRTSPAGTTRAGSTRPPSARAGSIAGVRDPADSVLKESTKHVPLDADKLLDARPRASGASRRSPAQTEAALTTLRQARAPRRRPPLEEGAVPAADRERAAPADRHLPRPADLLMSRSCHHCNEFSRVSLLRRGAAEAGRGLPAIEPGMPPPAGTGLDRRSFVSGALGARALGLRRSASSRACSRTASPQAAAGPAQPVLVSVFLPGGADSLSVLFPAVDPNYRKLRPTLALPDAAGPAFSEDTRLHWHPQLQPLRDAARRGQGLGPAGDRLHAPRPVALHLAPLLGGRRHRPAPGDRLDGPLPRPRGTNDNPLQGLSLDDQLQPALASTKMPVAVAGRARRLHVLGAGRLGRGRGPDARRRSARSARTAATRS